MIKSQLIKELRETGIIDVIGDTISIQDTDFRILYQNKRNKDIFGDQLGEYCYKAYQGKDRICDGCHIAMSFKDGQAYTVERTRTTDKGIMYFENTSSILKDSKGNIVAGIEVVRDITKRKHMEKKIIRDKDELELRVRERTRELENSNRSLVNEVQRRKETEERLRHTEKRLTTNLKELKETNIALKVILKQREHDKEIFVNNILDNMKYLVLPYIKRLKKMRSRPGDLAYLNILETNLSEIVSPFSSCLSSNHLGLTSKEIQIANLVRDGKQDKDIVEILNISLETVKTHRKNIRKKLGIYSKRINLRAHLLSLSK